MYQFPLELTPDDNGTFLVTCPVLPEVTTFGVDHYDALAHAREAVEEAIGARMSRWEAIPILDRETLVRAFAENRAVKISLLAAMKLLLFLACKEQGVSRADLARSLGWHREQVDRLFRLDHASKVEQIEAAFRALGRELDVRFAAAA